MSSMRTVGEGLKVINGGDKRRGRKASDETTGERKARAIELAREIFKEAESGLVRPAHVVDARLALRAVANLCTSGQGDEDDEDRALNTIAFRDMSALLRVISRSLEPQP